MTIAEMAARLSHYEGLERELDEAVLRQAAGKENVGGGADASRTSRRPWTAVLLSALSGAVPLSLHRRVSAAERRPRSARQRARADVGVRGGFAPDTAMAKVDELEGELRRAKSRAVDASQPYNYLVDRIADVERDADASARREREMGEKLEAARAAAHGAGGATALRKDLKAALDDGASWRRSRTCSRAPAGRQHSAAKK